jgi:hypothetical protein
MPSCLLKEHPLTAKQRAKHHRQEQRAASHQMLPAHQLKELMQGCRGQSKEVLLLGMVLSVTQRSQVRILIPKMSSRSSRREAAMLWRMGSCPPLPQQMCWGHPLPHLPA